MENVLSLRASLQHVLSSYSQAKGEAFSNHALAHFIRSDLRDVIAASVGDSERFVFKGSAGQANWAKGPWVGIFDRLVTTSAQNGYYPVYLFREDMQGLYLSLNQGMTEAKKLYRSDAKTALRARAANFRAMLGSQIIVFPELEIDLAPSSPTNDTAFYEAGNICAKYYPSGGLPSDALLVSDLSNMVPLYATLVNGESGNLATNYLEGDEPPDLQYEDATRFRLHKRIERNVALAKKVKRLQGYSCQVCSINFEDSYGAIGKNYIEAHHLLPLAALKGKKVALDPEKDFAVLCANCHRMVHRSGCVDDIPKFKKEHHHG